MGLAPSSTRIRWHAPTTLLGWGLVAGCGEGSPDESVFKDRVIWELRSGAERVVPKVDEANAAAARWQVFAFDALRLLSADQHLAFSPRSGEGETLSELEQALPLSPVNDALHRSPAFQSRFLISTLGSNA